MPRHACIDPHDQYAEEEVLVEFETMTDEVRLISARNAPDDDILSDLDDMQRRALESEILENYLRVVPSCDGHLHLGQTVDHQTGG